jgi:hypothetical protein
VNRAEHDDAVGVDDVRRAVRALNNDLAALRADRRHASDDLRGRCGARDRVVYRDAASEGV